MASTFHLLYVVLLFGILHATKPFFFDVGKLEIATVDVDGDGDGDGGDIYPEGGNVGVTCRVKDKFNRTDAFIEVQLNNSSELPENFHIERDPMRHNITITWRNISAAYDNGHGANVKCRLRDCSEGQLHCETFTVLHIARLPMVPKITGCRVYNWQRLMCTFQASLKEQQNHTNVFNTRKGGTNMYILRREKKTDGHVPWENFTAAEDTSHNITWNRNQYVDGAQYEVQVVVEHKFARVNSTIVEADTAHIVQPDPATGMVEENVTANSMLLQWHPPVNNRQLTNEVCITSKWDPKNKCKNVTGGDSTPLKALEPATTYHISLRIRPALGDGFWSKTTTLDVTTKTSTPFANPELRLSSFETVRHINPGSTDTWSATIHWKAIPVRYQHGPGLYYDVRYTTHTGGVEHTEEVWKTQWESKQIPANANLTVWVIAANVNGICLSKPKKIFISYDHVTSSPEITGFKVISDNKNIYVEWEEPSPHDWQPVFYWCKGSVLQGTCQKGTFNWYDTSEDSEHLPNDTGYNPRRAVRNQMTTTTTGTNTHSSKGSTILPLPPNVAYEDMLLGMALEGATVASAGIQWAKCHYAYDKAPNKPMKVQFSNQQEMNSLALSWTDAKCALTVAGYHDETLVEYWVKGESKPPHTTNTTQNGITLMDLRAGAVYVVSLYAVSYSRDGMTIHTSQPLNAESPLIKGKVVPSGGIAGIVIVSILVFFLFLVGVWAVFFKGPQRCKAWLFGISMYPPVDDYNGRSSQSSERHLVRPYNNQLSVRSGDSGYSDDLLINNMQASKLNTTTISNDTTLDDEVFDRSLPEHAPNNPPSIPARSWIGEFFKGVIGYKGGSPEKSSSKMAAADDGFNSTATSGFMSDYSHLGFSTANATPSNGHVGGYVSVPPSGGRNGHHHHHLPRNGMYHRNHHHNASATTSGIGSGGTSGSLPPYMLATVIPVYQNLPIGPPVVPHNNNNHHDVHGAADDDEAAMEIPRPNNAFGGNMPYVLVPQGHNNIQQGQGQQQQQFVPYVWLPEGAGTSIQGQGPLPQGPQIPYVLLPQPLGIPTSSADKPESLAFTPSDPLYSSSMEKLDQELPDNKPVLDLSPIASMSTQSPLSGFTPVVSQNGQPTTGMGYVQLPPEFGAGAEETDTLLPQGRDVGNGGGMQQYVMVPSMNQGAMIPQLGNGSVLQGSSYVSQGAIPLLQCLPATSTSIPQPPAAGSDYVTHQNAASTLGQPVFLQPFCNLPPVLAKQQNIRPAAFTVCRAPALPRIDEVNSGQSVVSVQSADRNSQSPAPIQTEDIDESDEALIKFNDSSDQSSLHIEVPDQDNVTAEPNIGTPGSPFNYFAIPVPNFLSPIDWSNLSNNDIQNVSPSKTDSSESLEHTCNDKLLNGYVQNPIVSENQTEPVETGPPVAPTGYVSVPVNQAQTGCGYIAIPVPTMFSQPNTENSGQNQDAISQQQFYFQIPVPTLFQNRENAGSGDEKTESCEPQKSAGEAAGYVMVPVGNQSQNTAGASYVTVPVSHPPTATPNSGYVSAPVGNVPSSNSGYVSVPPPANQSTFGALNDGFVSSPVPQQSNEGPGLTAQSNPVQPTGYVAVPMSMLNQFQPVSAESTNSSAANPSGYVASPQCLMLNAATPTGYVQLPVNNQSGAPQPVSNGYVQNCDLPKAGNKSDNVKNVDKVFFRSDSEEVEFSNQNVENSMREQSAAENSTNNNGYVAVPMPQWYNSQPLFYLPIPVPTGLQQDMDSGSSEEYYGTGARPKKPQQKNDEKPKSEYCDVPPKPTNTGYVLVPMQMNGNLPNCNGNSPQDTNPQSAADGNFHEVNGNSGKVEECYSCGKENYDPLINSTNFLNSPESVV